MVAVEAVIVDEEEEEVEAVGEAVDPQKRRVQLLQNRLF